MGKTKNDEIGWFNVLLSCFLWVETTFFTIFYSVSGILLMPLQLLINRESGGLLHAIAELWGRTIVFLNPYWKLKVQGRENIQPGQHYVVVANHQSALDILVLLAGLKIHFKFISKKEVLQIPFIGWHMRLAGYIPLDRGNRESGRQVLKTAAGWLRKKVSVAFFPEGTRSLDGQIHTFKPGAFRLAEDEKAVILPVVIDGTGDALPKKSWVFRNERELSLTVLPPVTLRAGEDIDRQKEEIRQEMMRCLTRLRKP